MDEIKRISDDQLRDLSAQTGFKVGLLTKDFYITVILYLIKDISGIYFKGGTALQKVILNHSRLSEDIDLTATKDVNEIRNGIIDLLKASKFFPRISLDRNQEYFVRIIIYYDKENAIFIDLNQKAKLLLPSQMVPIKHFYPENIPNFEFPTLASEELIAEKVRAAIQRNKPRDHFDIYQIIKAGIPIDLELVRLKCKDGQVDCDFTRMFNQAQKLKQRWDVDLLSLIKEEVTFQEVMKTLAAYFNLKQEKKKKALMKI